MTNISNFLKWKIKKNCLRREGLCCYERDICDKIESKLIITKDEL